MIRQALGEQKLSYYGVSWGADLGVVYSQLFPTRVDRMVVDSVTDVEGSEYHHLATGERTEAAFDEWAAWVAWRNDQYHLGRTGAQVRTTVQSLLRKSFILAGYRLDGRSLPFLLQSALGDESDRELMAQNVRTLLDAAAGRPAKPSDQLSGLMAQYFGSDPALDEFAAASFAFTCNDRGWPSAQRSTGVITSKLGKRNPSSGPASCPAPIGRTTPLNRSLLSAMMFRC